MTPDDQDEVRVPVVEETLSVGRRKVETDRVRVRTLVDTQDLLIDEILRVGQLDVTRVALDREVTQAPAPYHDGDTLVIPVVEERLVVEKRLFVVEELRVTASSHDQAVQLPVSLRRTRAVVERDTPDPSATGKN